jgi:hypothetical protein
MMRLCRVLDQDAGLQPWPILFADPGQFELSLPATQSRRPLFDSILLD